MDTDHKLVRDAVSVAQRLIDELHRTNPHHATFSQVGLLDGEKIVTDYLVVGELGCALHHALYMIHEANIPFPKDTVVALHELAERIGERNYYSAEHAQHLTEEQLQHFYNRRE